MQVQETREEICEKEGRSGIINKMNREEGREKERKCVNTVRNKEVEEKGERGRSNKKKNGGRGVTKRKNKK